MRLSQVAAQLYTLREFLKTPSDIAQSLKKVRAMGYEAVQLSGLGPIGEKELTDMLRGEGLTCCATHEPGQTILDNPEKVVERLNKLGCRYTAYPYPGGVSLNTLSEVKSFTDRLDHAGKVLKEAGQVLTYHNHAIEFRRVEGQLILDAIYAQTDPKNLQGEIDTYWVQAGGGDSAAWCERLKDRLPLLHLKDYGMDKDSKPTTLEIGAGNLDFKAIIAAAEASGCLWFIVEQDHCAGDPFESLAQSFQYIKNNLCP